MLIQVPQGWKCPSCGIVHAPWVQECYCHHVPTKEDYIPQTGPNQVYSTRPTHKIPTLFEDFTIGDRGEPEK
jgi:hypothetical protein